MYHPKRPHVGETEEDLLEQEREFMLAQSSGGGTMSAAAKVTRVGPAAAVSRTEIPSSSSSENSAKPKSFEFFEMQSDGPQILVKERNPEERTAESILKSFDLTPRPPLPKSGVRNDKTFHSMYKNEPKSSTQKKKSLFARSAEDRRSREQVQQQQAPEEMEVDPMTQSSTSTQFSGADFHPLCAGMTQEEIATEAKKLREKIDPKLLEFIQKRNEKRKLEEKPTPTIKPTNIGANSDVHMDELPINPETVKRFPNMDKVESEKLEWTLPVPGSSGQKNLDQGQGQQTNPSNQCLNARFDFKGELVPESEMKNDETWAQGLHHHGEEMERPGYTLQELMTLARSVNHQQRAIAFDTLAAIFENAHFGMFDDALDKSLFYLWSEMDCIYVMRKGLDNTDTMTINSSLNALAAMLYPIQEEMSLDTSYHWPDMIQPSICPLQLKKSRMSGFPSLGEQEEELKDPDFCQADLLNFLVNRSALLTRLDYLMREKWAVLSEVGTLSILKILIRIARHSPGKLMQKEFEQLLKYIAHNYANSNWTVVGKPIQSTLIGTPLALALKLFRILTDSSLVNGRTVFLKMEILPSVLSYLAYDQWLDQTHVKDIEFLVLEAFKVWKAFLNHGFAIDEYLSFFPVLMKYLHAFQRKDFLKPFDFNHAAHVFSLLDKILSLSTDSHSHWTIVKDGVSFVAPFTVKLLAQLSDERTNALCDFDLSLAALEQALKLLSTVTAKKYESFPSVTKALEKFLSSSIGYGAITTQILSHSFILAKITTDQAQRDEVKYSENFVSCGATMFGGRLNPILRQKTPFAFLTTMLRYFKISQENNLKPEVVEKLNNSDIVNYFKRISTKKLRENFPDNFFTRSELLCIAEYMEIIPGFGDIAYKLIPLVQKCDSDLFGRLVGLCLKGLEGNPSSFDAMATLLRGLMTSDQDDKKGKRGTDVEFVNWKGKIVSTSNQHWILEPFKIWYDFFSKLDTEGQRVYSRELQPGVKLLLEMINLFLNKSSALSLGSAMNIRMVYSRISLCYLMGYELFLDPPVRTELESILKKLVESTILKDPTQLVFLTDEEKKENPLRPSVFETLYSDLLEEYGASSFGDEVFTGYIFLPLRFGEGPNLKLKFMTADITPHLRITEEKSLIPLNYFTGVREKNPSVMAAFVAALRMAQVSQERQPFLYNILKFHVAGRK